MAKNKMEYYQVILPLKRGRPRKSASSRQLIEINCPAIRGQLRLKSLQSQYKADLSLYRFKQYIWEYFSSKSLPSSIFNSNLIEQLEEAVKEFMMSELEYLATIFLLTKPKSQSPNLPTSLMINICCYLVKTQMESDQEILSLLKESMKKQFRNFEEKLKKFEDFGRIQCTDLNNLYKDFQNFRICRVNYSIKVAEVLRISTIYCEKEKSIEGNCNETTSMAEKNINIELLNDKNSMKFKDLAPVQPTNAEQQIVSELYIHHEKHLFNDYEFRNGFYNPEDFEALDK